MPVLEALVERIEMETSMRSYCDISEHGEVEKNVMGILDKEIKLQGPKRASVR